MAVAFESIATTGYTSINGATPSITITKPTGLAAGDYMVACIGICDVNVGSGDAITGWTKLTENNTAASSVYVYAKEADSSDAAASNFTFQVKTGTGGTNDYIVGGLLRFSGDSPLSATTFATSASDGDGGTTNTYASSITPLVANTLIMMVHGRGAVTTVSNYAIVTSNPTWTERYDTNVNDTTDYTFAIATAPRTEVTDTGNFSADFASTVSDSVGSLVAVIEATPANVTGTTGVLNLVGNEGTAAAGAAVTGTTGVLNVVGNEGTVATPEDTWNNQSKSSSTWNNQSKS